MYIYNKEHFPRGPHSQPVARDQEQQQAERTGMAFRLQDKCLAFHGPLLYEARILKLWDVRKQEVVAGNDAHNDPKDSKRPPEPGPELRDRECYLIHYQGWKATWDEWVGLDRIRPYNSENLQLRNELVKQAKEEQQQQHADHTRMKKKAGRPGRKRADSTASQEEGYSRRSSTPQQQQLPQPKITLHIPMKLKSVLVNDWEYITKDKKICRLPPSSLTVDEILQQYEEYGANLLESPVAQSQLAEYCSGLRFYFNQCLPLTLLYRLERLQYDELLKSKDKPQEFVPTKNYGAIHLLRLLSILPDLISNTTMDAQSCQLIISQTENLLEWLILNDDKMHLFAKVSSDGYINTSSQYEGVALNM